jgi:hypothetical protein
VRINLGDSQGARPLLEQALAIADSAGNPVSQGQALNNLCNIARNEGDLGGAQRLAARTLTAAVGRRRFRTRARGHHQPGQRRRRSR